MAKYMIEAAGKPSINALTSAVNDTGGVTNVLKEKSGAVNFIDKVKYYYKSLITIVGMVLTLLSAMTPVFSFIPIDGKYITWAIAALTTVSVWLKRNEKWVNEL